MATGESFNIIIAGGGPDAMLDPDRSMPTLKRLFQPLRDQEYSRLEEDPLNIGFEDVNYNDYHGFLEGLAKEFERSKRSLALTLKILFPPEDPEIGEYHGFIFDRPGTHNRELLCSLDHEGSPYIPISEFESLSRTKWPAKLKGHVQFLKDMRRYGARPIQSAKLRDQLDEIFFP